MFLSELTPPGAVSGQVRAVMNDRNGYSIEGGWLLWEVLDPGPVTVTMAGEVIATGNGHARVVAISFSGVTDTVHVIVNAPPPEAAVSDGSDPGDAWEPQRYSGFLAVRRDDLIPWLLRGN